MKGFFSKRNCKRGMGILLAAAVAFGGMTMPAAWGSDLQTVYAAQTSIQTMDYYSSNDGPVITGSGVGEASYGFVMPIFNGGFGFNFRIGGDKWGDIDVATQFTYSYGNKVLNLSRLDYSTIVEKTLLRNCDNALGYGKRYSTFMLNGNSYNL